MWFRQPYRTWWVGSCVDKPTFRTGLLVLWHVYVKRLRSAVWTGQVSVSCGCGTFYHILEHHKTLEDGWLIVGKLLTILQLGYKPSHSSPSLYFQFQFVCKNQILDFCLLRYIYKFEIKCIFSCSKQSSFSLTYTIIQSWSLSKRID